MSSSNEDFIRRYWVQIAFLFMAGCAWGTLTMKVDDSVEVGRNNSEAIYSINVKLDALLREKGLSVLIDNR